MRHYLLPEHVGFFKSFLQQVSHEEAKSLPVSIQFRGVSGIFAPKDSNDPTFQRLLAQMQKSSYGPNTAEYPKAVAEALARVHAGEDATAIAEELLGI